MWNFWKYLYPISKILNNEDDILNQLMLKAIKYKFNLFSLSFFANTPFTKSWIPDDS